MSSGRARLRLATVQDLPAIERIEAAVFGNPWAPDAYAQEIERSMAVVELAQAEACSVIGFSCTWYVVAAGESEAHLLRIAVDPDHQRRGVGRDLLAAVVSRADEVAATRVMLEVGASNTSARTLYERAGFVEIGRRAGYYRAPVDDAVVMHLPRASAGPTSA